LIAVVDYGLGNVRAFLNLYRRLNIEAFAATSPEDLDRAERVILPGVGHFDHAMELLEASGLRGPLDRVVLEKRVPLLGICVGMQILGRDSDEGSRPGLAWVDGRVRSFVGWEPARSLPTPHMGWNDVRPSAPGGLFAQLEAESRFYFLHSYFFECANAEDCAAVAHYGGDFTCAFRFRNIHGVQFHPEKSHRFGTRLLQNFATL
jgi:glutamine amidotransferase